MGRVLKRGWAGLGYSGCLDMYPEPGIDIDLSSDAELEDGFTLRMGVSRPQDRFLQYLYDIILHKYGRVIPTARKNGGGIEMYVEYRGYEEIVEIHKAKKEADVYKVMVPRCLLRRLEVTGENRVYINKNQDDYFTVPAKDRDRFTQVLRIRCNSADLDWLTGVGQQPESRPDIRVEVEKLVSLFTSFRDWHTIY